MQRVDRASPMVPFGGFNPLRGNQTLQRLLSYGPQDFANGLFQSSTRQTDFATVNVAQMGDGVGVSILYEAGRLCNPRISVAPS